MCSSDSTGISQPIAECRRAWPQAPSVDPDEQGNWQRQWLRTLCGVDTTCGREGDLRPHLEVLLAELGARVIVQPVPIAGQIEDNHPTARANMLAIWGTPRLLLTTHLDTVLPHIPPRDRLDHAKGTGLAARGACDAKGQAIAQLAAIRRLLRDGVDDVAWLGVVGEETTSDGAIAARALAPRLATVDTIINGEPTDNVLARGQMGYQHLRLSCSGPAGHASDGEATDPIDGRNALWHLLFWLDAARGLPTRIDAHFGQELWNLGRVQGGEAANTVAGEATAEIVIRTAPGSTLAVDLMHLGQARSVSARVVDYRVEMLLDEPPARLDCIDGHPAAPVGFGSDTPRLRPLCPNGRLMMVGPGSILEAHTPHEYLAWSDLSNGIDLLEQVSRSLLAIGGAR